MAKFCDKCNLQAADDAAFCSQCGSPLKAPIPPPPTPVPAAKATSLADIYREPVKRNGGPSLVVPIGLAAVAILLAGVLFFMLNQLQETQAAQEQKTQEELKQVQGVLSVIDKRLSQIDGNIASVQSETSVLQEHIGMNEAEVKKAKALAQQFKAEQERQVQALNQNIAAKADAGVVENLQQESQAKFQGVSKDITEVKEEVKAGREELATTKAELSKLGVLVTEQGGMIATNSGGLAELRRRGERDYLSFDIRKKQRNPVGEIRIELKKADVKKGYADLKLYVDDRAQDYNKVYINKPLNLYVGRDKVPYEIVVNEVRKDQILGYAALPKGATPAQGSPALQK